MFGIKFEIKNEYGKILNDILENIENEKYIWKIKESEVLSKSEYNDVFFLKEEYENEEFKNLISTNECYPIFLYLQLFYKKENQLMIKKYSDFKESNCLLLLFITDNVFVEIYSKDIKIMKKINNNIVMNKLKIRKYIYEKEDIRKKFSAYY